MRKECSFRSTLPYLVVVLGSMICGCSMATSTPTPMDAPGDVINSPSAIAPPSSLAPPSRTASLTSLPSTVTATLVNCPTVPRYPFATLEQSPYRSDEVQRIANYSTSDSREQVLTWFTEHLKPPMWTFSDGNTQHIRFRNREADAYTPAITLLVEIDNNQLRTMFRVTLTFSHAHLSGIKWCSDVEP